MGTMEGMIYAIICIILVAVLIIGFGRLFVIGTQAWQKKKPSKHQSSSYVQLNTAAKQANEPSAVNYRMVKGFLVKLDVERQNRYMPGRNAYEMARTNGNLRSVIFRDANGLQKLLDEKAGTGEFIGTNKEKIDFGQTIGQYVDVDGRSKRETKTGIIHYTSEGAYIVPARPNEGGASLA